MYIRLKNIPDLKCLKKTFVDQNQITLYNKIHDDLSILDDSYGADRSCFSYGGYIILCLNPDNITEDFQSLCNTYHLNYEQYEFCDNVWHDIDTNILWKKNLYLFSSDDSLLIYYPTRI